MMMLLLFDQFIACIYRLHYKAIFSQRKAIIASLSAWILGLSAAIVGTIVGFDSLGVFSF